MALIIPACSHAPSATRSARWHSHLRAEEAEMTEGPPYPSYAASVNDDDDNPAPN